MDRENHDWGGGGGVGDKPAEDTVVSDVDATSSASTSHAVPGTSTSRFSGSRAFRRLRQATSAASLPTPSRPQSTLPGNSQSPITKRTTETVTVSTSAHANFEATQQREQRFGATPSDPSTLSKAAAAATRPCSRDRTTSTSNFSYKRLWNSTSARRPATSGSDSHEASRRTSDFGIARPNLSTNAVARSYDTHPIVDVDADDDTPVSPLTTRLTTTSATTSSSPPSGPSPSNQATRLTADSKVDPDFPSEPLQTPALAAGVAGRFLRRMRSAEPNGLKHRPTPIEVPGGIAAKPEWAARESRPAADGERRKLRRLESTRMFQQMKALKGHFGGHASLHDAADDRGWMTFVEINPTKGCLMESDDDTKPPRVIFGDLRGCSVEVVEDTVCEPPQDPWIKITPNTTEPPLYLRPFDSQELNSWVAALLCWAHVVPQQAFRTSSASERLITLPKQTVESFERTSSVPSNTASGGDFAVKSGDAMLLEVHHIDTIRTNQRVRRDSGRAMYQDRITPHKVLCVLRASGVLKVQTFTQRRSIVEIRLTDMPRSSIQILDKSVFGRDFSMAIYPQYTDSTSACTRFRPIFLVFDNRDLIHTWYALFTTFAIPELFGRKEPMAVNESEALKQLGLDEEPEPLFRIEHHVDLEVNRLKMLSRKQSLPIEYSDRKSSLRPSTREGGSPYYVEVCLDGQIRACTPAQGGVGEACWNWSHISRSLGSKLLTLTFRVRQQHLNDGAPKTTSDTIVGEASIDLADTELVNFYTGHLPLYDFNGDYVGDLYVKLRFKEEMILLERQYEPISHLLHQHENHLTSKINDALSSKHLGPLAEILLNIFTVSGEAEKWIKSLIEYEVGSSMLPSHSSEDPQIDQSSLERARSTRIVEDSTLLFRSNTLLTKAMDLYMKRLGRSWLEETVGPKMRELVLSNEDYEVDPSRLPPSVDIDGQWFKLMGLMRDFWSIIRHSVAKCPPELSTLFRQIRQCARERFGKSSDNVSYTSVSAFVFLRFFCPAVMSPQNFGLVDDSWVISNQTLRSFKLIAKVLQGMANLTSLGSKEPWMAPMNVFLSESRDHFKYFIDSVCSGRDNEPFGNESPVDDRPSRFSMSFESSILKTTFQLPPLAREGFPSLPDLIDGPRNFALLVNLWVDNTHGSAARHSFTTTSFSQPLPSSVTPAPVADTDLRKFQDLCLALRTRAEKYYAHASMTTGAIDAVTMTKFVLIAEEMEARPRSFWVERDSQLPLTPSSATGFASSYPSHRGSTATTTGGGGAGVSDRRGTMDSAISLESRSGEPKPPRGDANLTLRTLGWQTTAPSSHGDKKAEPKRDKPPRDPPNSPTGTALTMSRSKGSVASTSGGRMFTYFSNRNSNVEDGGARASIAAAANLPTEGGDGRVGREHRGSTATAGQGPSANSRPDSIMSGATRTSTGNKSNKSSKKNRSPPREGVDLAARKLGWI